MIDSIASANAYIIDAKDAEVEVTVNLLDGTSVTGDPISVNSKGVNLKVDGKVRSFGIKRIDTLTSELDEDIEADEIADDIEAELHDDMTTSELADLMGTTPKALRVSLRALGMGVGKGRKYSLHATAYNLVKAHVDANVKA